MARPYRPYKLLTEIENLIRGAYGYQPQMRLARRLMAEYFGWQFRSNAGTETMLNVLMSQCIQSEKERIGAEIMADIDNRELKATADAAAFLATWALRQELPPRSVIAACDNVLSWARKHGAEFDDD